MHAFKKKLQCTHGLLQCRLQKQNTIHCLDFVLNFVYNETSTMFKWSNRQNKQC